MRQFQSFLYGAGVALLVVAIVFWNPYLAIASVVLDTVATGLPILLSRR